VCSALLPVLLPLSAPSYFSLFSFLFHDTAPTEIYTLSLHDALPILGVDALALDIMRIANDGSFRHLVVGDQRGLDLGRTHAVARSEEHTSELQSRENLVCRLLLEKKKEGGNRSAAEKKDRGITAHST